jgi:UDP-2,4-diacetamido-2,4,6-trideoxy-beta-L-altropyranose hydrolase
MDTLLIRADASIGIGTGHVMRCLALAQARQDAGGRVVFAMAEATSAIQARIAAESCEVVSISASAGTLDDAKETIDLARKQKCDWIAVDGYQFSSDYQRTLKTAGFKILFLDDYVHAHHYFADLVLNQNVGAGAELYVDREPETRLLLGPRYCLLRREFGAWRDWTRKISPICRHLLVMMGGSDPEDLTVHVIEALGSAGLEELVTTVVIGGSNPNFATLQRLVGRSGQKIILRKDVSNMTEPMAAADVAISAGGSTCWELCLLALPMLLIDVAENQTKLVKELDRRGCAIRVGDRNVTVEKIADQLKRVVGTEELRQSLSKRSRELVDGNGAARVVSVLRGTEGIRIRYVRANDVRRLWEWVNDPEVRAASFSSAAISWQTHVEWFAKKFGENRSLLFIAEDEAGSAFGQIRFDLNGKDAELNISLAKERRGAGLAVPLIESAVREVFASTECTRVHAFVKPENAASARTFEKARFVRIGIDQIRGNAAVHFLCGRT